MLFYSCSCLKKVIIMCVIFRECALCAKGRAETKFSIKHLWPNMVNCIEIPLV